MNKPAWHQTLREYLRPAKVHDVPKDSVERKGLVVLSEITHKWLRNGCRFGYGGLLGNDESVVFHFMRDPDLVLDTRGWENFAVISLSTNAVIAGDCGAFPFVMPEFRGRGIMAEVFRLRDNAGMRPNVGTYTLSGLHNRIRTHRLHVQDALDRGEEPPAAVMKDYVIDQNGRARLREPYDADEHNRWCDARQREERVREFHHERAEMLALTQQIIDDKPEDVSSLLFQEAAIALVIALRARTGGAVRAERYDHEWAFGVMTDDMVMDAIGIRRPEHDNPHTGRPPDEVKIMRGLPELRTFLRANPLPDGPLLGLYGSNGGSVPSTGEMILRCMSALQRVRDPDPTLDDGPSPA